MSPEPVGDRVTWDIALQVMTWGAWGVDRDERSHRNRRQRLIDLLLPPLADQRGARDRWGGGARDRGAGAAAGTMAMAVAVRAFFAARVLATV